MEFEVETHGERPDQLESVDENQVSGITILPVYSPLSNEANEPVDAKEAATVAKLWEQRGVDHNRVSGERTLSQFSDLISLPPLYVTLEFIKENPEVVIVALETLYAYYERRTSDGVELDVTVESEDEVTSIKYS
jgi:hypothetical protein